MLCGTQLGDETPKFCPGCGDKIRKEPKLQEQNTQSEPSQQVRPPDPSNPYEIDGENATTRATPPPMGTGVDSSDNIGLGVGAAMMVGWGIGRHRMYGRRRRRAFFY